MISYIFSGWDGAILVSRSNDGEIIARILQRQGHETIRGSTAKGGLRALATLIKRLKARPRPGVIIPDGPQGPRFKVQPGVIILAKKTGYPIIPVTYSARWMKVFKSWDRFILPCPVYALSPGVRRTRVWYRRTRTIPVMNVVAKNLKPKWCALHGNATATTTIASIRAQAGCSGIVNKCA